MKKTGKRIMIFTFYTVVLFSIVVFVFMLQPKFGKIPKGERLTRIENSPNFKNGKFQNLNFTPQMSEEAKFSIMFKEMFFSDNKKPVDTIPSTKTDLLNLDPHENVLV